MLGATGSIAAYKAADLASRLTQAGVQVDVILSGAAEKFVQTRVIFGACSMIAGPPMAGSLVELPPVSSRPASRRR